MPMCFIIASLSAFALTHFRSVFFEADDSSEILRHIFLAFGQDVLDSVDAFPLRGGWLCAPGLRSILGGLQPLVFVDVAGTIDESLGDLDADDQFCTCKFREQRIVLFDTCETVYPHAIGRLEIYEQHPDLVACHD